MKFESFGGAAERVPATKEVSELSQGDFIVDYEKTFLRKRHFGGQQSILVFTDETESPPLDNDEELQVR